MLLKSGDLNWVLSSLSLFFFFCKNDSEASNKSALVLNRIPLLYYIAVFSSIVNEY